MSRQTAQALWTQNRELAHTCLRHPFVQGIASGELSRERFRIYVGQDAHFLEAYARAYALALAKSPDRETVSVFQELLCGVFEELKLHEGYAQKWDVDLEPEPLPATLGYCDFLLRTASLEPVGHIAAAMTPCTRLYAFLGEQLLPKLVPESPYGAWVATYAGAEVEALAARLEALLNRFGGAPARVAGLYHRALELELAFFQAAWDAG